MPMYRRSVISTFAPCCANGEAENVTKEEQSSKAVCESKEDTSITVVKVEVQI